MIQLKYNYIIARYKNKSRGESKMKKFNPTFPNFPHMLHGSDYNPEQWRETPEIWDEDMRLMKKANCNEMTMGIFAWAEIEPEEDVYDFSVLDTMMDKVYENGGRVILATPSGARPHWLADKYPDALMVDPSGKRIHFKSRHNHCTTSKNYRNRVRIINEKLAECYNNHPALIGWHLSNEYGAGAGDCFCHCDLCIAKFREWLKDKYGTIDELNRAWWTRFWSQRYDDFSQIEPPYRDGMLNISGLKLDWKRFTSDNHLDFMKEEIKALRKYSDKPVTTNGMCIYPGLNYRKFAKELDFFSQDIYPQWHDGIEYTANNLGLICDYTRGLKQGKPFIVMESAPGNVASGVNFRKIKSPAQQALEAVKYIAHGSDSVMYFQWRKGRGGSEQFHGAVVDHYGKEDNRVFNTISKTGEILKKLDGVVGTGVKSDVAITFDTENWWAMGQVAPSPNDNGYRGTLGAYYGIFSRKNIQTDVITYDEDFSKYKVVVLTSAFIMNEELAEKIKKYVAGGGTVIATYLTGVDDENARCNLGGVPGFGLTEVFGLRVDEVDSFKDVNNPSFSNSVIYKDKEFELKGIAEVIVPSTAKPLAVYKNDFYAGSGAIFVNSYGKGKAYYVGVQNAASAERVISDTVIPECGLKPSTDIGFENGVCIRKREGDGENYYFVMNETPDEKKVTLDKAYKNVLTGETEEGEKVLSPCGFLILTDK